MLKGNSVFMPSKYQSFILSPNLYKFLQQSHINYTITNNPLRDGADGKGGKGSDGGLGGRVNYNITYTYSPGRYSHHGTEFWANSDIGTTILGNGNRYREEGPRLLDNERGTSGNTGNLGQTGGNTAGQAPQNDQLTTDELRALKEDALQCYRNDYNVFARDPVKQKFLGRFPNL
ncbi:MAG: hypothetical protein K0M45_10640 [Candidatus Paracaedibacteraceae bacterium]|nr:hypothetical protein [Candidatus Paracaedibacteraceae bacterium]